MRIKFLGHLKNYVGKDMIILNDVGGLSLYNVLLKIYSILGDSSKEIFDGSPDKLRSSIILLVNDVVYDVLGGFDYIVNEDDELVFIPAVHG
ncbi:MAG: MoaD/ThiS family protein, partial [Candidatus Methanomethylicia archaeon]